MGGMAINTYLGLNPDVAAKLSGVIYSAPFFGMGGKKPDAVAKFMVNVLAGAFDEMVLVGGLALHRITRNKTYVRLITNGRKATPLLTAGLISSFNRNIDLVAKNASKVNYPYVLILGEKDVIVDNAVSRDWHSKTTSARKELKLMAGSYHELSKEPNNGVFIETILKFAAASAPKNFGVLDPKTVKFSKLL
jgi:alpha-beta hydrolase superfamily lysophospholipase